MLKISAKLQTPMLNLQGYKQALERLARETMSLAMFEYVVTATEIIPVWSGASQATFTELAQLAGVPLSITPSATARQDGTPNGASHGDAYLDVDGTDGKFMFVYQTDLPHLVYNEYVNANETPDDTLWGKLRKPGPYHFQREAGKRVRAVFNNFTGPDINRYIKAKRVK